MKKFIAVSFLIIAANFFIGHSLDYETPEPEEIDSLTTLSPGQYHPDINRWVSTILSRYHYKKTPMSDSLSSVIYDKYIKSLDYNKTYFLASDIYEFEKYRFEFDEDLSRGELKPAFEIFNTFRERFNDRTEYVLNILDSEFDFTKNEMYEIKRDKAPYPKSEEEANEIWRKRVKNEALNLKLAGKDWENISETLKKRYNNYRKNIFQYKSEDVFQLIMNSYSEAIDPHTNYLSPITSDNFKINMSLSLEGIGAQLQAEDDYTKVAEIIPGGPAAKSGLLQRNDRIIGVAQGDDGEMVDVIGQRLNDVVQLIRGPKETIVRLQILYKKIIPL